MRYNALPDAHFFSFFDESHGFVGRGMARGENDIFVAADLHNADDLGQDLARAVNDRDALHVFAAVVIG